MSVAAILVLAFAFWLVRQLLELLIPEAGARKVALVVLILVTLLLLLWGGWPFDMSWFRAHR